MTHLRAIRIGGLVVGLGWLVLASVVAAVAIAGASVGPPKRGRRAGSSPAVWVETPLGLRRATLPGSEDVPGR